MTEIVKQRPRGNPNWQKGVSANPSGRKKGNDRISKLRAAIADRAPEIIAQLINQALEGDVSAARLILERAVPPLKAAEQPQAIRIPAGTLTEQGRAILAAVAHGELAPGQGTQLLAGIAAFGRIIELDELTGRISKLELQHGNA